MKLQLSILPLILPSLYFSPSHAVRFFGSKNTTHTPGTDIRNTEDIILKFSFVSDPGSTNSRNNEFRKIKLFLMSRISELQNKGLMSKFEFFPEKDFYMGVNASFMYLRIGSMQPHFVRGLRDFVNYIHNSLSSEEWYKRESKTRISNIEVCDMRNCIDLLTDKGGLSGECSTLGGKCQNGTLQCTGSYVTGKCSGPPQILCCTTNITLQDTKTCDNVEVFSRNSWGARSPISPEILPSVVNMFFIHHTAGPSCKTKERCAEILRSIQRYHMQTKEWNDIAYSFLVGEDGRIYEGRGWHRVGSHTKGYNSRSLAVSVMGNYQDHIPNSLAINAVRKLLNCATSKGYIYNTYSLYGHRDVRDTECPGDAFYNQIRTWQHYNTTTDLDGPCLKKNGICKPDYLQCDGSFQKGLCNGYSRRQCCVPKQ